MIKPYTKNISDEEKDLLFLSTCGKYHFDAENDVLSDLVVEMTALIDQYEKNILKQNIKLQDKEKEADHFKSSADSRRKQQDKIRDINIITINNNYNNTFNSFGAEDGDDECGTEDMDQA